MAKWTPKQQRQLKALSIVLGILGLASGTFAGRMFISAAKLHDIAPVTQRAAFGKVLLFLTCGIGLAVLAGTAIFLSHKTFRTSQPAT